MTDRNDWTHEDRREYVKQMAVYGTVQLDADGKPSPRDEPDYWQHLRVAGRGYGKTSYAKKMLEMQEQIQRLIDKTDELHRLAAGWVCAPKAHPATPDIAGLRWSCPSPSGDPEAADLAQRIANLSIANAYQRGEQDLLDVIIDAVKRIR